MKIELSMIIPVYNVEKYIEKCIQSVINQTYSGGIECIIVDDCSPDASMEIVERILNGYNGPIRFMIKRIGRFLRIDSFRQTLPVPFT